MPDEIISQAINISRIIKAEIESADLPHSKADEEALLTYLFDNHELINEYGLSEKHFYDQRAREYFNCIKELGGLASNPAIVADHLRKNGKLEVTGGAAAVAEICTGAGIPSHFEWHLKAVRDHETMRRAYSICAEGLARIRAATRDENIAGIADSIREDLETVAGDTLGDDITGKSVNEIASEVIDEIQWSLENPGQLKGVSTGFTTIDRKTGGFTGSCLWVIGAESSKGKSTLARQFIENFLDTENTYATIYTHEMAPKSEIKRIMISKAQVSNSDLKSGRLTREDQEKLAKATIQVQKLAKRLNVFNVSGMSIERILRDAARRYRRLPKDARMLIEIDYIQLCVTEERTEARYREIAKITSKAKAFAAKRDRCDIIMPSQVNKDGDVRESSDIKNDADVLLYIKSPSDGKKKSNYEKHKETQKEGVDSRVIWCDKNRDGEIGWEQKVRFIGEYFSFVQEF